MDNFEFENKKKKRLKREPIYIGLCVLCLIGGLFGGYMYSSSKNNENTKKNVDEYTQIKTIIEDLFLDTTESKYSLKDRMLTGMVGALGDRYTTFMSSSENKEYTTSINGSFQGIGVSFTALKDCAIILEVYKGTPAHKAGVKAGDLITHVQGTSIAGYDSDKIKDTIGGEKGTEVTIRVLRNGKSQDIKILRQNVETSLSYEVRTSGNHNIGYIRLTTFGDSTTDLFENALKEFKAKKVETLCIDLRNNGGGYLESAKGILNLLVPEDKVLYKVQSKDESIETTVAEKGNKYIFNKGYILANDGSASASEVLSAGLIDNLDYQMIGSQTYGKGLVQTQAILKDSSVLKYTNARWLTPKGICIQGEGIKPTYEIIEKVIQDFSYEGIEKSYQYDQVDVAISEMQIILKELGFKVDREDGYFSKNTESAFKAFEAQYGLKVDGIYDKNDSNILLSALAYQVFNQEDKVYLKVENLLK